MKNREYLMVATAALFIFSGCAMRTYDIQQERPDQDLAAGNRGRVKGDVPRDDIKDRKTTRQVKVLELELLPLQKSRKPSNTKAPSTANESAAVAVQQQEPVAGAPVVQPSDAAIPAAPVFEEYKVQEYDTLQKISQKYYGSINEWMKIYDANRDILKSPDSIYPKQTLKIPVAEKTK